MWGGQTPNEPEALDRYISMIQGAGFNHMFTGNNPDLNLKLKQAGFDVYPRFGWFGNQFTIADKDQHMAAIGKDGKPLPKDFCPLQILAHPEHPELGRFFKQAADLSALPNIDGICVDFETAPVWCWCDTCLAALSRYSRSCLPLGVWRSHRGARCVRASFRQSLQPSANGLVIGVRR